MTISQFIWLLSGKLWIGDLCFWCYANKLNFFSQTLPFNPRNESRVHDHRRCIESCSCNASQDFALPVFHSSCEYYDWRRLNKLEPISHLTCSEVLVVWVRHSDKFCSLPLRYGHVMKSPRILLFCCFILSNERFSEMGVDCFIITSLFHLYELFLCLSGRLFHHPACGFNLCLGY